VTQHHCPNCRRLIAEEVGGLYVLRFGGKTYVVPWFTLDCRCREVIYRGVHIPTQFEREEVMTRASK
jgi:hypothetical protein